MTHRITLGALLIATACSSPAPSTGAAPAPSAEQAVRSFMQAAADSNLKRMAELWGTTGGPAAKTGQPPDYERRIAIIQVYLSSAPYRVLPPSAAQVERRGAAADKLPAPGSDTVQVVVQLDRPGCPKLVPFQVVKTVDKAWVVNQVDLAAAGHPKRPCAPDRTAKDSS